MKRFALNGAIMCRTQLVANSKRILCESSTSSNIAGSLHIRSAMIGGAMGVFAATTGLGGAVISTPLLSKVFKLSQHACHGTSLAAVTCTCIFGAMAYDSSQCVDIPAAIVLSTAALTVSPLGVKVAQRINGNRLRWLLGGFMILSSGLIGLQLWKDFDNDDTRTNEHKSKLESQKQFPKNWHEFHNSTKDRLPLLLTSGFITGFTSGFFGVGGGVILVPLLTLFGDMNQQTALGTSLLTMAAPTLWASLWNYKMGNIHLKLVPGMLIGGAIGAYFAGNLAVQLTQEQQRSLLIIALLSIGLRMYDSQGVNMEENDMRRKTYFSKKVVEEDNSCLDDDSFEAAEQDDDSQRATMFQMEELDDASFETPDQRADEGILEDDTLSDEFAIPKPEKEVFLPKETLIWIFPETFEDMLSSCDNFFIKMGQLSTHPVAKYFSLFITGIFLIEYIMMAPFIMFALGLDSLGVEISNFAIVACIISQIPKRFIWRWRPWMVGRATICVKPKTSSFPSRAVTCAVVYSFAASEAYINFTQSTDNVFQIWTLILVFSMALIASFARVNLGAHYPTDCIAGFIQGIFICALSYGLWQLNMLLCGSCITSCHSDETEQKITYQNAFDRVSPLFASAVILCCIILGIGCIIKPVQFWKKCAECFALVLPGITFQLLFLCPHWNQNSLPTPEYPPIWWSYFFALIFPALSLGFLHFSQKKFPLISFLFAYIFIFSTLVTWRLFVLP